jgi:tRNA G10  N-methylase Trm11
MKYIFILGQSTDLAKQELINILNKPNDKIELIGQNFILAETEQEAKKLMSILGGTIKIAKYLDTIDNLDQLDTKQWQSCLNLDKAKKNNYGFSLYNDSKKTWHYLYKLSLQLKKELKSQEYKARLVTGKQDALSSVIIEKNNLLNNELLIIKNNNDYLLAITEAIQDFAKYGHRDMNRPQRDDRSGMTPPKVAQMMINLAGPDRQKNILDPFCGSGTILQEAALQNFSQIFGTDNNKKTISDAKANLDWLKTEYNFESNINIQLADVKNLSKKFDANSIDLIVTEPFMGDARLLHNTNDTKTIQKINHELQELYLSAFQEFKKILKTNSKIVFIFPILNINNQKNYTIDVDNISKLGFELQPPSIKSSQLSPAGNIIYSRDGQKVLREITIWTSKN